MSEKNEKADKAEKKTDDGLAAKVRVQESRLNRVVAFLEKMFAADIDGDGKKSGKALLALVSLVALFSLLVTGAFAFSPATNVAWSVTDAKGTNFVAEVTKNGDMRVAGTITAATNATVAGTLTVTGNLTVVSGVVILTQTATAGAVAAQLNKLPTDVIQTNAVWFKIGEGTNRFVIPAFKVP